MKVLRVIIFFKKHVRIRLWKHAWILLFVSWVLCSYYERFLYYEGLNSISVSFFASATTQNTYIFLLKITG